MPSITLDEPLVEFIKQYLKDHRLERLQAGKDDSIVSVLREALFAWAEKKGILKELLDFLKQQQ